MIPRSVLGGLLFAAVFGFALVAPTAADAQDLRKKLGWKEDAVLNMMLDFVRDDVREVQPALEARGYDPRTTDEIFWPWTRDALMAFQRDHALAVTGRVDGATLAALRESRPAAASPRSH